MFQFIRSLRQSLHFVVHNLHDLGYSILVMKTNTTLKVEPAGTVFMPYTNTDLTEGRGEEYPLAYCNLRVTAQRLGKGKSVMGTDCCIEEAETYFINNVRYAPIGRIASTTDEDLAEARETARLLRTNEMLERVVLGTATPEELSETTQMARAFLKVRKS